MKTRSGLPETTGNTEQQAPNPNNPATIQRPLGCIGRLMNLFNNRLGTQEVTPNTTVIPTYEYDLKEITRSENNGGSTTKALYERELIDRDGKTVISSFTKTTSVSQPSFVQKILGLTPKTEERIRQSSVYGSLEGMVKQQEEQRTEPAGYTIK